MVYDIEDESDYLHFPLSVRQGIEHPPKTGKLHAKKVGHPQIFPDIPEV
jgi:hypothetical protein